MTTVTDICKESLALIGTRTTISSIDDGSPEANACRTFYTPILQSLLRSAHWNCARFQTAATILKQLYNADGTLSTTPPASPWLYEYLVPADSLKERFVPILSPVAAAAPPLTTGGTQYPVPPQLGGYAVFVVGLDLDSKGNRVKIFYSNQYQAQIVYTADISQQPDLWDSQFHVAASAALAAYLVNPLARNAALLQQVVGIAQGAIASARATDGNEGLPSQDHMPDWIRIRMSGGGWGTLNSMCITPWDAMVFPGGERF